MTFLKVNADVLSRLRIKDAALNSFRFYNANAPQNLSDEELKALDRFSENKTLVVQKTDNGNSVVLVDRDVFVKHRENIVRDNTKFEKVDIKTRTLNFQVNPEKSINEILKSLTSSGKLSDKQCKIIKAVGSRPGVLYGFCKVHKAIADVCPPFRPILTAIGTSTYKIAKFLVPIMSCLTINGFTVKDSLQRKLLNKTVTFIWVT